MSDADNHVELLVREPTRWHLTPVPASTPVEVSLEAISAKLAPEDASSKSVGAPHRPGLPANARVAPIWTWVGRLTAGRLLLDDHEGEPLTLDLADLQIVDCLKYPVSVAELSAMSGVEDAPQRLARLVAAGKVKLDTPRVVNHAADSASQAAQTLSEESEPGETSDSVVEAPKGSGRFRRMLSTRLRRGQHPVDDQEMERPRATRPATPFETPDEDRIGVHSVWQREIGPLLSLGMLTASAREWNGGELAQRFNIHSPQEEETFFDDLTHGSGPAVLLCSNYVWSLEYNLTIARRAKQVRPGLVVIHGGPSTPKNLHDAELFLKQHGDVADILVRGEGEVALCRVLSALKSSLPRLDVDQLEMIPGLTFIDPTHGATVRTGEPERISDLSTLPSPYLTGVYDHVAPEAWLYSLPIETNRGCPYGCTFCDWGSATLSRIRMFDVDKVLAEFRWAAEHQLLGILLCDANFGITGRDVTIAQGLAEIRREYRTPSVLSFTPAKNTTKHITKILDLVIDAGFLISTAISLQTTDEETLKAVKRSNISTDNYLALAADLRRRGLPIQGDLLIGLPGQTYASYKADVQFFVEHEIAPRSWSLRTLPNAPMNDPEYRARYQIESDAQHIVTTTSTLDVSQRERILALRKVQVIADQFGVFSQIMRLLQWDYDIPLTDFMDRLIDTTTEEPTRFPLITWVIEYFDLFPTCPIGWTSFYSEVADWLACTFDIDVSGSDIVCALNVQQALMPSPGRTFSSTVQLQHDFVSYYTSATNSLYTTGLASVPARPLRDLPPSEFTISSDPLGLCTHGVQLEDDSRDETMLGQFWVGIACTYELESPLRRVSPEFRDIDLASRVLDSTHPERARANGGDGHPLNSTPVTLLETSRRGAAQR